MIAALAKTCRPHQWIKNLFVAAPLVFARRIDDRDSVIRAVIAFGCFCLLSSAVYLLNDIVDVERDRVHPLKRHRPIASGALPIGVARVAAGAFAAIALGISSFLSPMMTLSAAMYLGLNVAYSFWLKRVPFVDVGCITGGFLLRVLGGAYAIGVPASYWLLLCTFLLASMLGFGKRAHELRTAGERGGNQRAVLERYHPGVLRLLLVLLAALTVLTYAAYTQSAHALSMFHTRGLAVTVPFVAFGIVRFLWITNRKADAESPTDSMLRDRLFLGNLVLYAFSIVAIIYRGF